jgi:hypothetical protein
MFEFTKNGKKRKKRRKESKKERKKEKGAGTVVRIFGLLGKFIEIDYVQYVRIIIRTVSISISTKSPQKSASRGWG